MKKKVLLLGFILSFFIVTESCTQSKKDFKLNQTNTKPNMDTSDTLYIYYQSKIIDAIPHKEAFMKRFRWLLDYNYGEFIEDDMIGKEPYRLECSDLEQGAKLRKKSLTMRGLKDVSEEQFYKQIYKYFNFTKDEIKSEKKTIFTKDCFVIVEYTADAGVKELLLSPEMKFTYFYPKKSMITSFPDLFYLAKATENNDLEVSDEGIDYLYHYNNYLLYDSKSSLTWLSINAPWELLKLFKTYKYYKEPKINQIGLDFAYKEFRPSETRYNQTNNQVLFDLFFEKKDNKIDIHEELLKYISEGKLNEADYQPVEMMYDCGGLMLSETYDIPDLTREERLKIATYLGYYIQLYYEKYQDTEVRPNLNLTTAYPGSFLRNHLTFIGESEFLEHMKKNNFHNLPGLKEMVPSILEQIEIDSKRANSNSLNN